MAAQLREPTFVQRLAALYFILSWTFGSVLLALFYLLVRAWHWTAVPLLTYAWYTQRGPASKTSGQGTFPTPLRRWRMWEVLRDYFGAEMHRTAELSPSDAHIFGYHPHGILSQGAVLGLGSDALGFSDLFPGVQVHLLTLAVNFMLPFFREYLLAHGHGDVSRDSCLRLLRRGHSIAIVIGGGAESLYARPGRHELVLRRRQGFVKLALDTGASLVPVYCFGENNTFVTAN
ncbi:diacylglycerol acyltransferase, partial [Helicosporidium sp. ATCC 50920]